MIIHCIQLEPQIDIKFAPNLTYSKVLYQINDHTFKSMKCTDLHWRQLFTPHGHFVLNLFGSWECFLYYKCLSNRNRGLLAYDSIFIWSGKAQIIIMAQIFIENSCSHLWKFCAEPNLILGEFLLLRMSI